MYSEKIKQSVINYYIFNKNKNIMNIAKEICFIFKISQRTFFYWKKEYENKQNNLIEENKNIHIGRPKGSGKITKKIEEYITNYYIKNNNPKMKNVRKNIMGLFNLVVYYFSISVKKFQFFTDIQK